MVLNTEYRVKRFKEARSLHIAESAAFLVMAQRCGNIIVVGKVFGGLEKLLADEYVGGYLVIRQLYAVYEVPIIDIGSAEKMGNVEFIFVFECLYRAEALGYLLGKVGEKPAVNRLSVNLLAKNKISYSFCAVHISSPQF